MRGILWFDVVEDGTGYTFTRLKPDLLKSNDPCFRPIAMTFGPDGALYVVDFYSPVIENTSFPGRARGRDLTHGRIWRTSAKGSPPLERVRVVGRPPSELLDLFV